MTADESSIFYVGTYTRGEKSQGIYQFEFDSASGKITPRGLAGEITNPSFLAIHPNRKFLYSVIETSDYAGKNSGGVAAFAIEDDGKLTLLNEQPSGGGFPCHVIVDADGKNVLVANYGGGNCACLPIDKAGRLAAASALAQHVGSSVDKSRQSEPHAHSVNLDAANKFAYVADLGLDKIMIYRFDPSAGSLMAGEPPSASVPPGGGPRHLAFHPSGKFVYVINEMGMTVTAFKQDRPGELVELQTISTLPDGASGKGFGTAEILVHPSGKFLYGSNRGHDSMVVYTIDQDTGKLTYVENVPTGGAAPRNFALDPSGKYLLAENQSSDSIVVFKIDLETGALTDTGEKVDCSSPVCIKFLK